MAEVDIKGKDESPTKKTKFIASKEKGQSKAGEGSGGEANRGTGRDRELRNDSRVHSHDLKTTFSALSNEGLGSFLFFVTYNNSVR